MDTADSVTAVGIEQLRRDSDMGLKDDITQVH